MIKAAVLLGVLVSMLAVLASTLSFQGEAVKAVAVEAQEPKIVQLTNFAVSESPKEVLSAVTAIAYSKSGKPLEQISIFSDSALVCITDKNGICVFSEKAGKNLFKASGDGFSAEQTKEIKAGSNTVEFEAERTFEVKVSVFNLLTDFGVKDALVQVDGNLAGLTDSKGELKLSLAEGEHTITASSIDSDTKTLEVQGNGGIELKLIENSKRASLTV